MISHSHMLRPFSFRHAISSATFCVLLLLSSHAFAQLSTIRFVGITPTAGAPGEWSAVIHGEGCDAILIPPFPPQDGGLLEVSVAPPNISVRIGFDEDAILGQCPSPIDPNRVLLPLGALAPGSYQLELTGVTVVTGGSVDTPLGTYQVVVPGPPRRIPSGQTGGYVLLLATIAAFGFLRMRIR